MAPQVKIIENGLLFDRSDSFYPSKVYGHLKGNSTFEERTSTYFGFVVEGEGLVHSKECKQPMPLQAGMYFAFTGPFELAGTCRSVVIERKGYRGYRSIGGPVEEEGRLLYIDNCRSSLLIAPARRGDPCLNLLSFPSNTVQAMHNHPTDRLGVVISGRGACRTPGGDPLPLTAGQAFMIAAGSPHGFQTEVESLRVIAYHPDSDWGPTDESHPMLNRTFRQT